MTQRHELSSYYGKMVLKDLGNTGSDTDPQLMKNAVSRKCRAWPCVVSTILGVFPCFYVILATYEREFYNPHFTEEETWLSLSIGECWHLNKNCTWTPVWTAHLGNTTVGHSPERLIETQTSNRTEKTVLKAIACLLFKFVIVIGSDFQKGELHSLGILDTLPKVMLCIKM